MAVYESICVGIVNPICFARSGMVSISPHVSGELHEFVATSFMSWLSCLIASASVLARFLACTGVTGMYDELWASVVDPCVVGICGGASAGTCVVGTLTSGVSLEAGGVRSNWVKEDRFRYFREWVYLGRR